MTVTTKPDGREKWMLFRFCLYGFLKNQTYFDPFFVLFLLSRGLTFFQIGIVVAVREGASNLLDSPTGAIADIYGRRRCMVASFVVYIAAFAVLGFGTHLWLLFIGVALFGGGEAFRGGVHKAMILDWLRSQGREKERTRIYGLTRSWSKIGSAVSVLIAAALVFATSNYTWVFFLAIVPYVLNLINLATYPAFLDGNRKPRATSIDVMRHLLQVGLIAWRRPQLRRLLIESVSFEGVWGAIEEYLQPLLKLTALSIPALAYLPEARRSAVLVGAVYFVLHLVASLSSRYAHRFADWQGGDEQGSRRLWVGIAVLYAVLLPMLGLRFLAGTILFFILMSSIRNLWRPMLISRFDRDSEPEIGATLLSFESQIGSVATMLIAPVLGWTIDFINVSKVAGTDRQFWPVAVLGFVPALAMLFRPQRSASEVPESEVQTLNMAKR